MDIIVTSTRTRENARDITSMLREYTHDKARVLYYLGVDGCGGVSEHDWLLYTAATAPFICHIDFADASSVRAATFEKLAALIATIASSTTPSTSARERVPLPADGIPGVTALYRGVHNNERRLRHMSTYFANGPPRVALLVPMSLRGVRNGTVPILKTLAPALASTFSHSQLRRGLYLGIDEDEHICTRTLDMISNRFNRDMNVPHECTIRFPKAWRDEPTPAKMYNALFLRAMMDGYDFAVQLQDDARPETPMWDRLLGSFLCSNPLAFGAYSMQDRYAPTRLTNIMVSRTFFDVFGMLFNEEAPDTQQWVRDVLGSYAAVVPRASVTNTIRVTRRLANGTAHVYAHAGESNEALVAADRARMQRSAFP